MDFIHPGSDDVDPIVATAVVKGAVQVEDLHGDIDGVRYIAASTAGGGTCGLHAIWGRCAHEGAPLQANMARAYLLDSVPSDVAEICRLQNANAKAGCRRRRHSSELGRKGHCSRSTTHKEKTLKRKAPIFP